MKKYTTVLTTLLLSSFLSVLPALEPAPDHDNISLAELREIVPENWITAQGLEIVLDPSKKISVFVHNIDGRLTPVKGSPFPTEIIVYPETKPKGNPLALALSPTGRHLFVADSIFQDVTTFLISDNGTLIKTAEAKIINFAPFSLAISPDGHYLFVDNKQKTHRKVFLINNDGSLAIPDNSKHSFFEQTNTGQITRLLIPLPKKWRELQAIALSSALHQGQKLHHYNIKNLPEVLEETITQMILGEDIKFTGEVKLEKQVVEKKIRSLTFDQLINYLFYQYDKNQVVGGIFKRLASRFVDVKRGTLSPKGFKILEEWAKDKDLTELNTSLERVQEYLHDSNLSPHKKSSLKAIQDQLFFYKKRRK